MRHGEEKMSAVDAAWLGMDSDVQHMVINAAFVFAEPLTFDELLTLVRERVVQQIRFRQHVVSPRVPIGVAHVRVPIGTPHWVEAPEIDVSAHVHRLSLPAPGDEAALARLIGELASRPLDRERPLWAIYFIERHEACGLTCPPVVLVRLHHAVGDGVSLMRLLMSLTDHDSDPPKAVGQPVAPRPHGIVQLGRMAAEHTAALARMLLLPGDPETAFRGPLGPEKRVAWTRPLGLARMRAIAERHGAKLNDVLVAVVAGAIRRYLRTHDALPPIAELRALVPLFLRGHGDGESLGNHFGLVFIPLLVGIPDPHERVKASKARNDIVKGSPDAMVALEVLAVMGAAGPGVEGLGIDIFTRKASCMITNVPGPTRPLRMAGRRIADMISFAPVAGHVSTGITMVTYAEEVRLGIIADAGRIPDPETLARACEAELDELIE